MVDAWLKIMRELDSRQNMRHLEDRIFQDILVNGEAYKETEAINHKDAIGLLGQLMLAHQNFIEKNGLFGDMFGRYLTIEEKLNKGSGQFFTPEHVRDLMTQMSLGDIKNLPPQTLNDPAAGTGGFMLSTAKHYVKEMGCLNFIFFNTEIDFRAFVYCVLNAVLNGIPSVTLHGDSLAMKYYDGFVTIPVGQVAMWKRIPENKLQSFGPKIRRAKTVKQTTLF